MKKIFYLETCNTCQRIMAEIGVTDSWEKREIKSKGITFEEVDQMKSLVGNYEVLFSKRAMKYRAMGLHERTLTEDDYRRLITEEYTFLKRPVILLGDDIYVGNSKKTIASVAEALEK